MDEFRESLKRDIVLRADPPLMNVQERSTAREGLRFFHRIIRHPAPRFTPTMFVSGAFQTMDSWARFAEAFAPHTTVLLVDPPGMGRSDTLPPDFGIDFLAGCLEQVLDETEVGRANLIAASYGTPSAYRLAAVRPDRVDRIVLAGTMKELPGHLRTRIAGTVEMARKGMREALAHECADGMLCHDPERAIEKRKLAVRVLRSGIVRMSDADLLNYAANTERLLNHGPLDLSVRIHGPEALVFTGEHDVFTRPDACREIASAFERGWFTMIRRADHLFHLERWNAVASLILGFSARTLGAHATDEWHPLEALNAPMPPELRTALPPSSSEPRVHHVVAD
jgi:pimeloyl-ACP methyl ester carboxylesterase